MLNTVALMGRLVADPELKTTPSGVSVTSFRIAVDRSYSSREGGERQADFIDIVAWRGTAEFVCKYFTKGQMIALQGRIQTRSYEDKQGNKRMAVEVVAENVHFCGSKRESGSGDTYAAPQRQETPQKESQWVQQALSGELEGFDAEEDLPF